MKTTPPAISSRSEFVAALGWGFEQAFVQSARRIVCSDPDFSAWPLDDEALHSRLAAWLRLPQRRLVLLAASFDAMPRHQPRFVAWRMNWVHAMEAWLAPPELAADVPTLLVDELGTSVQLMDAVHWRGRAALDAGRAQLLREQVDATLQRSQASFAIRTLGL